MHPREPIVDQQPIVNPFDPFPLHPVPVPLPPSDTPGKPEGARGEYTGGWTDAQEVSADELEKLSGITGNVPPPVDKALSRVGSLMAGLDRRGWGGGGADSLWGSVRRGWVDARARLVARRVDRLAKAALARVMNSLNIALSSSGEGKKDEEQPPAPAPMPSPPPQGQVIDPNGLPNQDEREMSEKLAQEDGGHVIEALPRLPDQRNPDVLRDGVRTELKRLKGDLEKGTPPTSESAMNATRDSIKRGGQARHMISDGETYGLTEQEAERTLGRLHWKDIHLNRLDSVRIYGRDYDVRRDTFSDEYSPSYRKEHGLP